MSPSSSNSLSGEQNTRNCSDNTSVIELNTPGLVEISISSCSKSELKKHRTKSGPVSQRWDKECGCDLFICLIVVELLIKCHQSGAFFSFTHSTVIIRKKICMLICVQVIKKISGILFFIFSTEYFFAVTIKIKAKQSRCWVSKIRSLLGFIT